MNMANNDTQALAKRDEIASELAEATGFSAHTIKVAMDTIGKGLTPSEFGLFLMVAHRTGLDPFARQIYAIKRKAKQPDGSYKEVMTLQTGIDGFRSIGARSKLFAGMEGPFWCGKDGIWRDIWTEDGNPFAAKVGVYLKGSNHPVWGIAKWREYCQNDDKGNPIKFWKSMPDNQIAKCAEAQAWRKAFPYEMGALKAEEEITREEAADDSPHMQTLRRLEEATPAEEPKGKRFLTSPGWPTATVNQETGEVYEGEVVEEDNGGRLL
jgi:phage recombination protein Bet